MKKLKWIVLAVVAVIVIGLVVVFLNLNGIIRSTIQSQGTASLNVPLTLESASLSILGGNVGLKDLQIGSPEGFQAPKIMTLGGLDVKVNYGELRGDPIRIQSIVIDKPVLVVEQSGGKLNFKALADGLPASGETPKEPAAESKPMKLIINNLELKDAQVMIRPGIPGVAQEIPINIPTMTLQDVGSGGGEKMDGVPIKDVVMETMTKMVSKAAESDKVPKEVQFLLKNGVDGAINELKSKATEKVNAELGKALEKLGGGDKGGGGDAGKGLQQGLEGLLGGKSKQPTTKP